MLLVTRSEFHRFLLRNAMVPLAQWRFNGTGQVNETKGIEGPETDFATAITAECSMS
jgi:hypothetical protein